MAISSAIVIASSVKAAFWGKEGQRTESEGRAAAGALGASMTLMAGVAASLAFMTAA